LSFYLTYIFKILSFDQQLFQKYLEILCTNLEKGGLEFGPLGCMFFKHLYLRTSEYYSYR